MTCMSHCILLISWSSKGGIYTNFGSNKCLNWETLQLTVRSWLHAEQCKRLTIRRTDVAGAICHADMLSFLVDILRPDESQVL
ncbi:hypothetical protein GW17_00027413 [Ensete ventricosum]|nr:hypothetical protein GW17_00027413 [Ensete ventricosum]